MRLHVLGLPHTQTRNEFSHCAFTGKVRKFGPMMKAMGYEVIHYGVGDVDNPDGWSERIEVMTPEEQEIALGYDPMTTGSEFVGRDANVGHPLYKAFNKRLHKLIAPRVHEDDIICLSFGHAYGGPVEWGDLFNQCVETGIGYPTCVTGYRIYESFAWMHWHLGTEHRNPWASEWVIPNYFDPHEWPLRTEPLDKGYVLYMGRIADIKGMNEIYQMSLSRPDLTFVICGQGDPKPWLELGSPNLEYLPPVHGMARAALMHNARCVVMPSNFVEPFGGVAIEAMMTGTPVITSNHSAFVETNPHRELRCQTKPQWLAAIDYATELKAEEIRNYAVCKYSLNAVGWLYDDVFKQIPAMRKHGWDMGVK